MIYACCDHPRRTVVAKPSVPLNGIDYLEVRDDAALPVTERQRTLFVHFLKPLAPPALGRGNVSIEGGERIREILVMDTVPGTPSNVLTVTVDRPGDFSTYTLRLHRADDTDTPPAGFDPVLSAIDFSFKVDCASDLDCQSTPVCPPETLVAPDIDYLAKDYGSFRRLMLDRLALLVPDWRDRNPADVGIALVELLAYVADHLSYQQDAIATEAYLDTARRRVSVRRHARLLDYAMHDGCNARAWVHVEVRGADPVVLPEGTPILTRLVGRPGRIADSAEDYAQALQAGPAVFETIGDETLHAAHNRMPLYAWGDHRCCLPTGATRATLEGHFPALREGDVLVFEEVLGPRSGRADDADPTHRHAVRLTAVRARDENGDPLVDPLVAPPADASLPLPPAQRITEVRWAAEDALPFPLCVSARTDEGKDVDGVSVAIGNIVLADHGRTIDAEALGAVPASRLALAPASSAGVCGEHVPDPVPVRYRPVLARGPLTHAASVLRRELAGGRVTTERVPFDPSAPAAAAFSWRLEDAMPVVWLTGGGEVWTARRDLLSSGAFDPDFVVEVERDGAAVLRFGDDEHGQRPEAGWTFEATYRVGNGTAGNVGADTLAHVVTNVGGVIGARNPMAARGGVDPETIEDVRQRAPHAFRTQERAVTPDDYAAVAQRHAGVQRAAATFRWTGSWHTVFVTVDRERGVPVDEAFEDALRGHLERFRMAGHDVEVDAPRFVALELGMFVCVKPDHLRRRVYDALADAFSSRTLPDGRRGFFHPDNFTFGQPVQLSRLYAAAHAVPGVASVRITKLQRQGVDDPGALDDGEIVLGPLEIARLDNDPNFPEHGVLALDVQGGR
ncbi:MAG: putative baseplate assembly protein [Candidatus Rokubacteria bacterium]|nr:putative baseplate assembly protein [Candidatus Rokubacteria bacterium]